MVREIVLDTETTGLDARKGDRLIELGCVELLNRFPTGREFHRFLNPGERDVHPDAQAIHGISTAFLKDKPTFQSVVQDFLAFIGDDTLVIHNAPFDVGFINMELERLRMKPIGMERVIDTLQMARRKFPGGANTLDGLCRRFNIDNSKRTKHGAITDSLLLADVYVELIGARQSTLGLAPAADATTTNTVGATGGELTKRGPRPVPLATRLTAEDAEQHAAFVETLGAGAMWKRMAAS